MKKVMATESQDEYPVKHLLDKEPGLHGWAIDTAPPPDGVPRRFAVFVADKPFGFEGAESHHSHEAPDAPFISQRRTVPHRGDIGD